jgi:hypothetical protein
LRAAASSDHARQRRERASSRAGGTCRRASLSFVIIGLFVATVGFAAGLDTGVFRLVSAILLIGVGTLLLVPRLDAQAAAAAR